MSGRAVRPRTAGAAALLTALVAVLAMLAGCTGVPQDSPPQVVRTLPVPEPSTNQQLLPATNGESPRAIVKGFLDANLTTDAEYTVAKTYLTPEAKARWAPTTVTVVNGLRIGNPIGDVINVTADERLGTVDAHGEYTPDLASTGRSADTTFAFRLRRVNSQWRISEPPQGLILDNDDFISTYRRTLYFFDSTNSYLVPDIRYTALAQQSLSSWLLNELVLGPSPVLAEIAQSSMPQVDPHDVRATLSAAGQLTINIPGSSHLDANRLRHLGAQLAYTFDSAEQGGAIRLTDGSTVVTLDGLSTFTTTDFAEYSPTSQASPTAYYLHNGLVYAAQSNRPLSGPFGTGRYHLTSVAVRQRTDTEIDIAGLSADGRLLIGSQRGGVRPMRLPAGRPTRPDWNRISGQLWIGVSNRLYATTGRRLSRVSIVDPLLPLPTGPFRIRAVRLSPEASRVALVISSGAVSSLWIGGISTTASGVQVVNLAPITQNVERVTDVGWSDGSTLAYIGTGANGRFGVSTILVDGSGQESLNTDNLPGPPTSIAITPGALLLVVAVGATPGSSSLWQEKTSQGEGWEAFAGAGQQTGSAPTFAV
jgi:Lipoprotein LpqB beta-propeller domain